MTKPEPNFTMEELTAQILQELQDQQPGEQDGFTTAEIAAALPNVSKAQIRKALHALQRQGQLFEGHKIIKALGRRRARVPTYRILPPSADEP